MRKFPLAFPRNAYQGEYVKEIAHALERAHGRQFYRTQQSIHERFPRERYPHAAPENFLDTWLNVQREVLEVADFKLLLRTVFDSILGYIKNDLEEFGVTFDDWFPESRLMDEGLKRLILLLMWLITSVSSPKGMIC